MMKDKVTENIPSENIKVSVILPVWNSGQWIDRCITSLRNQSLKEIEMIFVDDRGTDDAMAKVRAAAKEDPRIRVIVNSENIGPGPSRNAGIDAARGDYLLFVDPDDYIDLTFLEELYREASAKDLSIVKGSFVFEKEDGTQAPRSGLNKKILNGLADGKPLYTLLNCQHQSVLISRLVLLDGSVRYGTTLRGQDTTFLLRLCCVDAAFGICFTSGAYHYFPHDGSGMPHWDEQQFMRRLDGFREKIDFLLSRKFDSGAERYVLDYVAFMLWMHSGASAVGVRNQPSPAFLAGLREQVLRCPLSEETVNSDMKIRGLVVYGENLVQTPYRTRFTKPGVKDHIWIIRRWLSFIFRHPRELPFVFSDFIRTVKRKK